ncbi:hypothetical protein RND81_12G099900 [Saponaria officinalis]|uniref:Protein ABIL2-like n=1 Tax=Saponaria officinalis TaxID=3572 RepID=A0AAW1H8S1_SAPOF
MVNLTAANALSVQHRSSNYDETSMQESLLFADSLKDLMNLRTQLYNAAEYFELSYTNDDQKQLVIDTLKEYAVKALVNTVDHLGSVTYKVDQLLDEKVEELSAVELQVSCIEQRLRTCQKYINGEGITQQSSIIDTPKYHKRYVLPAGQTMDSSNFTNLKYRNCGTDEDDWLHFRSAVRATVRDTPSKIRRTPSTIKQIPSFARRGRSISPSRTSQSPGLFSFTGSIPKKDKRSVSPQRFPLLRSGSLASRPSMPKSSRPSTTNPDLGKQSYIPGPWKSVSMRVHDEKEMPKDIERYPSKSKRLLKALLSKRKSKKDDTLFTYFDDY